MKTLTITDARQNLGHWLRLAANGEDVGVIVGSDIIALRKVSVQSADYAYQEYGLAPAQVQEFEERIDASIKKERRAKTVKEFKGDWRELRG
jgi:antitoxin (DNA-binding transcriptional repressor) of toxin-antitoxin stability system